MPFFRNLDIVCHKEKLLQNFVTTAAFCFDISGYNKHKLSFAQKFISLLGLQQRDVSMLSHMYDTLHTL